MHIEVRTAHSGDAQEVCDLLCRSISQCCTEDHRNDPAVLAAWLGNKTPDNVASWFACPSNIALVAEVAEHVGAVAILTRAGKIVLFYVSPELRFRGIGKQLLNEVERQAAHLGLQSVQVPSTQTARRFYENSGYQSRCTSMAAYGAEAINMTKALPASPRKRCGCGG